MTTTLQLVRRDFYSGELEVLFEGKVEHSKHTRQIAVVDVPTTDRATHERYELHAKVETP